MELCWVEMRNLAAGTFSRLAAHRKCEEGRIQNEHGNEKKTFRRPVSLPAQDIRHHFFLHHVIYSLFATNSQHALEFQGSNPQKWGIYEMNTFFICVIT